ncbi:hypothetical protein GJAV_G00264440 [Gymnothorax javanicus]|nr:hypothetical protein GJAV_G00264440 [Gymnothorax javanicus]
MQVSLSRDPPVDSDGQQRIGGHVQRHGPQVVNGGAEQEAVVPGKLLHYVVIHQEGAAYDGHDEVRHGQIRDEEDDADENHADHDGRHEKGATLRGIRELIRRHLVVHVVAGHEMVRDTLGEVALAHCAGHRCRQASAV